jgi:hypothetical protein
MTTRARSQTRPAPRHVFRDRHDAGRILADLLGAYCGQRDVVVLGLIRGGIPVTWEVAAALGVPLDAFIVRQWAHRVTRNSRSVRWQAVAALSSTTTFCGHCESSRRSYGTSPNVKAANRPASLVSSMISRDAAEPLDAVRLGRAIGVIYLPETERQSHYYTSVRVISLMRSFTLTRRVHWNRSR